MKTMMTALMCILMVSSLSAQDKRTAPEAKKAEKKEMRQEQKKVIEAKRAAFITERADLTPAMAKEYWAMETAKNDELKTMRQQSTPLRKLEVDGISDKDALQWLEEQKNMKKEMESVEEKYDARIIETIGAAKYVQIMKAEREFKKEVLKEMRSEGEGERERPMKGRFMQEENK